jgi:hypothetical protein
VYRRVQLPSSWVEKLTAEMDAEMAERRADSTECRTAVHQVLADRCANHRVNVLGAPPISAVAQRGQG